MTSKLVSPNDAEELAHKMIEAHEDGRTVTYETEVAVSGKLFSSADRYEIVDTDYKDGYVVLETPEAIGKNRVVLDDNSFAFIQSE